MKLKKYYKKVIKVVFHKWTAFAFSLLAAMIIASNIWVSNSTNHKIFKDVSEIPDNDIGLVLGTSKKTSKGYTNLYFKYRIKAASELYKAGKIKHIIVSGDNSLVSYNEPREMHNSLIEMGVPSSAITLDFAGFRTLDSVVRGKEVFGQDEFTIISQEFHNQRALFIANKFGIDAVGYAAKDVPSAYSFKTETREFLAKFKAVIDLYVINKKPRFLGDEVKIEVD